MYKIHTVVPWYVGTWYVKEAPNWEGKHKKGKRATKKGINQRGERVKRVCGSSEHTKHTGIELAVSEERIGAINKVWGLNPPGYKSGSRASTGTPLFAHILWC